jgi:3',5'-cyclic AMP phosphodiesterase CpdA
MKILITMKMLILCSSLFVSNATTGKILHISDIHLDTRYHIGGVDNCVLGDTGMGCCRKYDIPKKTYGYASEWGNYNCDAPIKLVNETFRWIRDNIDIDAIIYTGDAVDHHDVTQTIGYNLEEIETVFQLFHEYFSDIPLFHSLGNHDTYPIDQTPPYIYSKFLDEYNSLNIKSGGLQNQNKTLLEGGYFYDYFNIGGSKKKIKVISLNTMYYDTNNLFTKYSKDDDIKGQWAWLDNELNKSSIVGEKVWLLLHIPPSNDKEDVKYKNRLISYLSKYKETIVATFSGHIHSDNFKLYFDGVGVLVGFGTIPSSIMPNKINPSFRVIEYDNRDGKLLNYKQYYADLNDTIKNGAIDYKLNYDFRELYGVDDFSKESFLQIYHNMRMNSTVLNKYWTYNKPDGMIKKCSGVCRSSLFDDILIR